jgi:tripartite-type tricarboxylate transporter receptor subunit TctC
LLKEQMMKMPRMNALLIGSLGAGLVAGGAAAQQGADFFKDKTVNYIVATSPGGGYDFYGRLVADYMQKYLPGSTFVVRNVPGAGHIVGANTIYASDADGTTIGTFNTGLIYNELIGLDAIRFELDKMSWIGKAAADPRVVVVSAQSDIRNWADLMKKKQPVNFSTAGIGSAAFVETTVLQKLLNMPIDVKTGYNGSQDQLAMRRGEIVGTIASRSSYQQFVDNGYGRFIAQIGGTETDVPQLSSLVEDADAKAFIALVASQADLSRLTAGPPGIPAERLAALREAYTKAVSDPEFKEKAERAGRPLEPLPGEEVEKRVKAALDQPPKTIALLKEAMSMEAPMTTVKGTIEKLADRNKEFAIKTSGGKVVSGEISGSRTKVSIKGSPAKRGDLKVGMRCSISSAEGSDEAAEVACN